MAHVTKKPNPPPPPPPEPTPFISSYDNNEEIFQDRIHVAWVCAAYFFGVFVGFCIWG